MMRTVLVVLSLISGLILLGIAPDSAQAQFYKGKTITMIVNYPAEGPTDLEGRIVALHLPAHIPGNPTIVVKNVGGAGEDQQLAIHASASLAAVVRYFFDR